MMRARCLDPFLTIGIIAVTGMSCGCGKQAAEHAEARRIAESTWQDNYDVLPLGRVSLLRHDPFGNNRPDLNKNETTLDDLEGYEVLQRHDVVTITANEDLAASNRGFSWQSWHDLTQRGVTRRLTVVLKDPKGNRYPCPETLRKRYRLAAGTFPICLPTGSGTLQEIVRSQKFQLGTKQYWLIMANYRWTWAKIEREIEQVKGRSVEEDKKLMLLAVYDDFSKSWQVENVDYAPRTAAFRRQREFDNFLAMAKFAGTGSTE